MTEFSEEQKGDVKNATAARSNQSTPVDGPAEPHNPELSKLIYVFERRATYRRYEAYSILAIIFILLAVAVYVFTQAKDIASDDTSTGTTEKRAEIQQKLISDQKSLDELRLQLNKVEVVIPFLPSIDGRIIEGDEKQMSFGFSCVEMILNKENKVITANYLINKWKDDLKKGDICLRTHDGNVKAYEEIRIFLPYENGEKTIVAFDPDKLNMIVGTDEQLTTNPNFSEDDIHRDNDKLMNLIHEVDIDGKAIELLSQRGVAQEIERLTGVHNEDSSNRIVNPLQFIIQLNIVRFGTITLIGIAISILSPLYRFSARLSAFYQAKADTLRLHEIKYKRTAFGGLTAALTPPLDFAKAQNIPDYLADLLRISIGHTKNGDE